MPVPEYLAKEGAPAAPRIGVRAVPIMEVPAPGAIGGAVAQLGEAAEKLASNVTRADHVTREMRARTAFMAGLQDLREKYAADPDPTTAPRRFRDEVNQLRQDQLGTIADPAMRAAAEFHMEVQALQAQRHMNNLSEIREQQGNADGLTKRRALYMQQATGAGSAAEREAIVGTYENDVDTQAAAGIYSRPQADAAKARFRNDVAADDARALIAANPDHAAIALDDPRNFPGLDPFARAELRRQADAVSDGAAWRAQQAADRQANAAFAAGTLDAGTLDAAADHLSAETYRSLKAAISATRADDFSPDFYYARLMEAATGAASTSAAAYGVSKGMLDQAAFKRVLDVNDRWLDESGNVEGGRPWVSDQRSDLLDALRPKPGQSAASIRAQLDATELYDKWLDQNPEATEEQGRAQMNAVLGEARAAAAVIDRASLPLPAGVTARRGELGAEDIVDAATRLRDAHAAFQIDDDTMAHQAELLRQWQGVVAGTSSK